MPQPLEPQNLNAIVSVTNARHMPKLLIEDGSNFTVLSVKPLKQSTSNHNTVVTIKVDLAHGFTAIPIPEADRYSVREVPCTRIDLKDIVKFKALDTNADGSVIYSGSGLDFDDVILALDCDISESELTIKTVGDRYVVTAKPNSLGYIGALTFALKDENGEQPPPKVIEPTNPPSDDCACTSDTWIGTDIPYSTQEGDILRVTVNGAPHQVTVAENETVIGGTGDVQGALARLWGSADLYSVASFSLESNSGQNAVIQNLTNACLTLSLVIVRGGTTIPLISETSLCRHAS